MNLTSLAIRNLMRRPGRTALTLAGVTLAIAAFVTLVALARGIENMLNDSFGMRGTDIVITERGTIDLISSLVPDDLAAQVLDWPMVDAAAPELVRLTSVVGGASVPAAGWPPESYLWQTLDLVDGRLPAASDRNVVVLGQRLAERLDTHAGGTLELFYTHFDVIGTIESKSVLSRNLIFMPLRDLQDYSYREGQATTVHLRLKPGLTPAERDQAVVEAAARLPEYAVDVTEDLAQGNLSSQISSSVSWAISAVALVLAIMSVLNTLGMAVNERRGEIAIMRAVGWPPYRIIGCVMIEGLILAAVSGVVGTIVGYYAAEAVAVAPLVEGFIQPTIGLPLIVYAIVGTLLLGLLGSFAPAIRATSLDPADILRGR